MAAWADADGWTFDTSYEIPQAGGVGASVYTCGSLGGVLGPTASDADPIGILYKNVNTFGVPHTHAWLDIAFVFLDDWESSDPGGFIDFEYQDRLIWSDTYVSDNANLNNNLCSPFNATRDDLVVDISRGILHDPADGALLVLAAADGDNNSEGFAIDDVFVWVR